MRAVLANFGSTGSIYPYVALAVELRRHGHAPVLALPPSFSGVAARHGIEFRPIGPDQLDAQTLINESMGEVPDDPADIRNQLAPLAASLPRMFADLGDACAGADVLLCGPVQPAGLMVHETTGIPYVSIQNVHYASGGTRAFQSGFAQSINSVRRDLGLAALHDPMMQANDAAVLVLFAMSRHVRARPSAWPPHYHLTGYFFLDDPWSPDPDLEAFLQHGPRPVAITFGSMTHHDPRTITDAILDAVRRVGLRAVLQQGWSGLGTSALDVQVHVSRFIPHDWLFPRVSLVVHHGGSGTTASVFRAGVPSVFVPHAWDQPIWAQLAQDLGCARASIPLPELTADRLADALQQTLQTASCFEAAADLGRRIRTEHGVRTARLLLEELAETLGF